MTGGRVCPSPGCGESLPFGQYACRTDWFRLPAAYRRAVNIAWKRVLDGLPGSATTHEAATAAADAWLTRNPRP